VIKPLVIGHAFIKLVFPGMTERGVSDIVRQRQSLCEIFIQTKRSGDASRDLGYFQ
tara:strand:+ start:775 stop:942 length:168 start_codon:yes stop_codon:yes gene_type:complete